MASDFSRILTLLRKERGISQKQAAVDLQISQALLSHYEKGIRECGLNFLVRCADYYGVSCDYLLGRSPDRTGATLQVEDLPDAEDAARDKHFSGSMLPTLHKKLVGNSLNIVYDLLARCGSKALTTELSGCIMLAVYKVFRMLYAANGQNKNEMFVLPAEVAQRYADSAAARKEANAAMLLAGKSIDGEKPFKDTEKLRMTTESLSESYPQYLSSLLNLIKTTESNYILQENK